MKPTGKFVDGISFHGHRIMATLNQLKEVCGEPSTNSGDRKSRYMWDMEASDGTPFIIYDWKIGYDFDADELIHWHIGALRSFDGSIALYELGTALDEKKS